MSLTIAHRCLAREGEQECGDAITVRLGPTTWVGVFDGLGHGGPAAAASRAAVAVLEQTDDDATVDEVMRAIDSALVSTRGAAGLVCRIRGAELDACIVGNIELRASPATVPALATRGILGRGLKSLRVFDGVLAGGSRLLIYSDGLGRATKLSEVAALAPEEACDQLLLRYRRITDDSSVLIADYVKEAEG